MLAAVALTYLAAAPNALEYDLKTDLVLTAGMGAWWLVSEYAVKSELAPAQCRWCVHDELDDAARAIRAPVSAQKTVSTISDITGPVLTPIAVLGIDFLIAWKSDATWRDGAIDALLIIEAMVASQAVNQGVKFLVGRERPFVSALPADQKALTAQPSDNNLSFFSGHSSYAFSLVAAVATIARARGYQYWWVVLAAGLPLAATTALLRMVADKHYLTDVLAGAAIGTLIGWGVPALFHRPVRVGPVTGTIAPSLGGAALVGTW
jgi:membrane-associated phospholipid phosphatase